MAKKTVQSKGESKINSAVLMMTILVFVKLTSYTRTVPSLLVFLLFLHFEDLSVILYSIMTDNFYIIFRR